MMPLLTAEQVSRLVKLCGMLGSAHDGERAAAAKKADDLVKSLGRTWHDVFGLVPTEDPNKGWLSMLEKLKADWRLTKWEKDFIGSMANWNGDPTPRQMNLLIKLYRKYT